MKAHIVLGLGFGDEGKGITTSSLVASLDKPIVVRFNGGHQAGHTVVDGKTRHVFSNFGSGTLHGAPTVWSKYCTFDPAGVYNEFIALRKLGIVPTLFVDMDCPLVTAYDKYANWRSTQDRENGTCGVGFGKTIERQEQFYKLYVRDMFYPSILKDKLRQIHSYYRQADGSFGVETQMICEMILKENMFEPIDSWSDFWSGNNSSSLLADEEKAYQNVIYEGAQGILLDQDYGFFPHVTRSNTTGKNATELYETMPFFLDVDTVTTYYVTRAYQTRHGNGPMTNETLPLTLKNNEKETNVTGIQGPFRTSPLDLELLRYSLSVNKQYELAERRLVITCLDQIDELDNYIPVTDKGENHLELPETIASKLGFHKSDELITFNSPETKKLF